MTTPVGVLAGSSFAELALGAIGLAGIAFDAGATVFFWGSAGFVVAVVGAKGVAGATGVATAFGMTAEAAGAAATGATAGAAVMAIAGVTAAGTLGAGVAAAGAASTAVSNAGGEVGVGAGA